MTNQTRESLIDAFFEAQRVVQREVHRRAGHGWLDKDLTMAQLKTLFTLADAGSASIGQVAEALEVGVPTASHLVDRLVQARLAERAEDPTDRRRILARLTPAGEEVIVRMRQGPLQQLRAWLAQLDEEDLVSLVQGSVALARVAQSAAGDSEDDDRKGSRPSCRAKAHR